MTYRCIAADPPWPEYGGGGRGAQQHYGLLSVPDIAKTMLRSPVFKAADDAHLWLWTTDNYMQGALSVMEILGFRFVRTFVWVKLEHNVIDGGDIGVFTSIEVAENHLQIGLGQYARGAHELCLFGVRGSSMVPEPANRPPSVYFAPREEHSRKPAGFYSGRVELVSPGPRLEMFARSPRAGWDVWGNETERFTAA